MASQHHRNDSSTSTRMTETAQGKYNAMMKDVVSPGLRDLGFKGGAGRGFIYPSETHYLLVGFQKSAYSSVDSVSFCVNLLVHSKKEWEQARQELEFLPKVPSPNTRYPVSGWAARLEDVTPEGFPHWFDITNDTDTMAIADTVVTAIGDYALPALLDSVHK